MAGVLYPTNEESVATTPKLALLITRVWNNIDNPYTNPSEAKDTTLVPLVDNKTRFYNRLTNRKFPLTQDTTAPKPEETPIVTKVSYGEMRQP